MILNKMKSLELVTCRTFKNFGHKRQPIPTVTVLWHGFLTFTFIGMGIEWKKIAKFLFGEGHGVEEAPWQQTSGVASINANNQQPETS